MTSGGRRGEIKVKKDPKKQLTSIGIILAGLGLTYLPIPFLKTTVNVVIGSELAEALEEIEDKFEDEYPNIEIELKVQGSQDIISNFIQEKNDFKAAILMPANGELLKELETTLKAQGEAEVFYDTPKPIAKTVMVGVGWEERGNILFPGDKFDWNQIEKAINLRDWGKIGGKSEWGSFNLVITDPTRSNSGQLTLYLWAQDKLKNNNISPNDVNKPEVQDLFKLVKKSVYQPPRSTDILLQEFIARGPNDADVATVYESIALYRWQQAKEGQKKPYKIYYPNPTIETTITGAVVKKNIGKSVAKSAQKFLDYLTEKEQQVVLAKYGFRPVIPMGIKELPNTPWTKSIPGVEYSLPVKIQPPPNQTVITEIEKLWYGL
ncbi:MAG TPA: substrate-binding domain-containing protein [Geminocystis sp. M7585_C2015_104]|nr:substrate-binding domain-containing protein [Geminocystis sp. M7585_C2015_104]